jgi:NAD(P)-dependent dehydrogenase (short-subunit alcohol dehydrogenase family)
VTAIPANYTARPDLLRDRVILISGAGDGIGRVAATTCAAHGATVILLGRTVEKLEAVYDEIEAAGGPQAVIAPLDLLKATIEDYESLANAIDEQFGRLDGLLHNAAIAGTMGPVETTKPAEWMDVIQVNVNAQMLLTRALLPLLRVAPSASLVFTSSGVGRTGRAYWGAYAVSKFATEGFMQVLADELGGTSAIRVNSLNPGATRTAMRAGAYPAEDPATLPTPADIMPAYLYLLGDDSRGVHGQALSAR